MGEKWKTDYEKIDGFIKRDIRICLDKNQDDYIDRFMTLPRRKFNFSAAFFGGRWFVYRLMLKEGVLLWGLDWLVTTFLVTLLTIVGLKKMMNPDSLRNLIKIGIALVYVIFFFIQGVIADQIYWKKLKRELTSFGRKDRNEPASEEQIEKMKEWTGVSIKSVIFVSILWGIANNLVLKHIIYPIILWGISL